MRTDKAPTVVAPFGSYNVVRPKSEEKRIMLKNLMLVIGVLLVAGLTPAMVMERIAA